MNELEIASYLDRGLSAADRDRIENHLSECEECRASVTEAQQLVGQIRRPRRFVAIGGVVAAAAAVTMLLVRPDTVKRNGPVERAGSSSSALSSLNAYSPLGERSSRRGEFVWSSAPDVVSYRLTVGKSDGSTIWSSSGTDTMVVMPDSIHLDARQGYVWIVDAILGDGSTRSTGLKEFGQKN